MRAKAKEAKGQRAKKGIRDQESEVRSQEGKRSKMAVIPVETGIPQPRCQ
jgi:hypothetical protein